MARSISDVLIDLSEIGSQTDDDFNLARAALLLASVSNPSVKLERYLNHIEKLVEETAERYKALLDAGADENIETRLAALKHTLVDKNGYLGDHDNPDHIQNADLIRVIDRGKGGAVCLSILYTHICNTLGWLAYGISLPSYFAVMIEKDGRRLIFDPFEQCHVLHAADLRRIVKRAMGQDAELSADFYEPVAKRDMIIKLQNLVKTAQIEREDYEGALNSVEAMRALAPKEYRLLLDAGVLLARTNHKTDALEVLQDYISQAPDARDRQQAALLLQEIRHSLDEV